MKPDRVSALPPDFIRLWSVPVGLIAGIGCLCLTSAPAPSNPQEDRGQLAGICNIEAGKIRLQGTAVVMGQQVQTWLAETKTTMGKIRIPSSQATSSSGVSESGLQISFPVRSIKSVTADGQPYSHIMDRTMHRQLQADEHPTASFSSTNVACSTNVNNAEPGCILTASGLLAVAGKTNQVTISASVIPRANRSMRLVGMCDMKMSDFGITPPSSMDRKLVTQDSVKVSFELSLIPEGP